MKRSGIADLPLHGGRVPAWLAERMTTLGTAIVESVVLHYGTSALLSRLSLDCALLSRLSLDGCSLGLDRCSPARPTLDHRRWTLALWVLPKLLSIWYLRVGDQIQSHILL